MYLTHCYAKKDHTLKKTREKVTPDKLYIATPTQRFINKCIENKVNWAIFSDKYGIWFSNERNVWYEKSPNKVTEEEFKILVSNFNEKLKDFDEIYFYYNPGRFHKLYKRLLENNVLKTKIRFFTHLKQIK